MDESICNGVVLNINDDDNNNMKQLYAVCSEMKPWYNWIDNIVK